MHMMQAWHEQEQEKEEEDPTAEQAITGTDEELEKEEQSAEAILSLHATSSAKQAKTLQIPGKIRDLTVIALVDSDAEPSLYRTSSQGGDTPMNDISCTIKERSGRRFSLTSTR
jgi:hypothetical protein